MKKLLLIILSFVLINPVFSQEKEKKEKLKIDIHGFVKTDYWVDTRQVVYAREGLFTLFPKDISLDKNGRDINAEPSFNFSAITSRLNFKIKQFKAFGADAYGFIEADFSGMSNITINTFRLRHAYINLDWGKSELLLKQARVNMVLLPPQWQLGWAWNVLFTWALKMLNVRRRTSIE